MKSMFLEKLNNINGKKIQSLMLEEFPHFFTMNKKSFSKFGRMVHSGVRVKRFFPTPVGRGERPGRVNFTV